VRQLLVATTNQGKQAELRRLLAPLGAQIEVPQSIGLDLEVPEPHDTYAENAVAKAVAYANASGLVALADDSGIEVAALGWGPGVGSARWGGDDKVASLLEALDGATDRRARMVCVLALAIPADGGAGVETFSGVVDGIVAPDRRGSGGFGYDPVFLLPSGVTTAELDEADKDAVSHRGRAVAAALERIGEVIESG
jgi:XTP/dITP diphosphohydrolase